MNTVERIKEICKERNIAISALEDMCGFPNAAISGLKKGELPSNRLIIVSEKLGVSPGYLVTGEETEGFSEQEAHLLQKIRQDRALSDALAKYFELSDAKKKHIIDSINLLSEV